MKEVHLLITSITDCLMVASYQIIAYIGLNMSLVPKKLASFSFSSYKFSFDSDPKIS